MLYQLWITDDNQFNKYSFTSGKEAYLYYLDNYATQEDFEYYNECSGKSLYDIADNDKLIASMFRNVFDEKHHLYIIVKNKEGTVVPVEIDKINDEFLL